MMHSRVASPRVPSAQAIAAWQAIVGSEHVVFERTHLDVAGQSTMAVTATVGAMVRPATRDEVVACVRVANDHGVPLYPFSSGRNWGYGSRSPVRDGVLLDLSRLNRIVDFDERLAYVTVEPGVTQRQLFEFLRARNSGLWMDATGASPDCSIVGNTMERGFGHTPMGDHAGNACALEVVLPTGDVVETGFGRYPGARAGALGRAGVGPSIDGLFFQSNLGVVTRMTVWLMPAPERFSAFFFSCQAEDGLVPLIDALRPLRLNGTLRSVVHVGNDYKVIAATRRYPWEDARGQTPMPADVREQLRKSLGIGSWNGSGGLYGTKAQVKDARAQLRRALAGRVRALQFVDDRTIALMERFAGPASMVTGWDVRQTLKVLRPVYNLLKGTPTDASLESAYWRKRGDMPVDLNPDRDRCGLLWCSPVLPNTGEDAAAVARIANETLHAHGFEAQMSISLATERSLTCVITVSYDRDVPGEDERALACYHLLLERLIARGYPPYRLTVRSMEYSATNPGYTALMARMKTLLDPNEILAPGRYEAGRRSDTAAQVLRAAG